MEVDLVNGIENIFISAPSMYDDDNMKEMFPNDVV